MQLTLTYQRQDSRQPTEELRCCSQGESRRFAWAVFPSKQPLQRAGQPVTSTSNSTASQSNKNKQEAHKGNHMFIMCKTSRRTITSCMISPFLQRSPRHTVIQISDWQMYFIKEPSQNIFNVCLYLTLTDYRQYRVTGLRREKEQSQTQGTSAQL